MTTASEPELPQTTNNKNKDVNDKQFDQNPFQLRASSINKYEFNKLIGKKSEFINLYIYMHKTRKVFFPFLRINRQKIPQYIQQSIITELKIQRSLHHKVISIPLSYIPPSNTANTGFYIIYDAQNFYSIKSCIDRIDFKNGNENDMYICNLMFGIISGISYLHQNGMVHGDLRPSTVLVSDDNEIKLFGYNFPELYPKLLIDSKHAKSKYTAPELLKDYVMTKQSDIYSLGFLLARIILNKEDFKKFKEEKVFPINNSYYKNEKEKFYSIIFKEIGLCTYKYPMERPSIIDIEKRIFNAFISITQFNILKTLNYLNSIVKYNPKCPTRSYSNDDDYMNEINLYIGKTRMKLKPLEPVISKNFNFILMYLKFQIILLDLELRNIENAFTWIILNMDIKKENICKFIADEILNCCKIRYSKIKIYAWVMNQLILYSLPTNQLGVMKDYILDTLKRLAITQDIYPNYVSYCCFISILSNRYNIYTEQELADVVKYVVERAPSKIFAFLPFVWFNVATKHIYIELYDSLMKLMNETECQPAFKLFVMNHSGEDDDDDEQNALSFAIQRDDVIEFKKNLNKKPDLLKKRIRPMVFDPCYLAHYEASIPLYVAYYNASKIFIYLHSTGIDMESTDKRGSNFTIATTVGDLKTYIDPTHSELVQKGQFEAAIEFQRRSLFDKIGFDELFRKESFPMITIGKHNGLFALVLLLSHVANLPEDKICSLISERGLFGQTIIHAVVQNRRAAFLKILLSFKDLDFNVKDSWGKTPLHYACQFGATECARLLLKRSDIDVNIEDEYMNSPIHYAAMNDSLDIIKLMKHAPKFDINKTNKKHQTGLHISARLNNVNMFKFLLENKADPSIVDNKGRTAYEIAVDHKFEDILQTAEEYIREHQSNQACRI